MVVKSLAEGRVEDIANATGASTVNPDERAPRSVVVIEHRRMPSTDYFVLPRVARFGVPVSVVDSASRAPEKESLEPGTLVVFVRYVDSGWAKAVTAMRNDLSGVVLFIDDDLFDWNALAGLPLRYRYKIWRMSLRRKTWFREMKARLWVANDYLAEKYRELKPMVVAAAPGSDVIAGRSAVRIFYHGTASHSAEIRWLAPIVQEVQERCDDTFFEVFGGADVYRLYRTIPRTAVLHPMSWPSYRAYTSMGGLHIGLAPLLPGRFAAARSNTKFLDFVRCGAVGIYSDVAPYAGFVRDGVDGLLIDNDPVLWVEAILRLVQDGEARAKMAKAGMARIGAGK
jgi:hypothetical protein